MTKNIAVTVVCFFFFASSFASNFKLNQSSIELQFAQSNEVEITATSSNAILLAVPNEKSGNAKSKTTAGILAIIPCIGPIGIHRYYLGHSNAGLIHTAIFLATGLGVFIPIVGGTIFAAITSMNYITTFIDGIMYLTATDAEFNKKYLGDERFIQWLDK